ncbi:hypothetical protein N7451_002989 [Penicillium sp. IBT 35674x]|nr:hypothetical protein N7451_002989 [Penicillium sp. IBT 35674x]
MPHHNTPVRRAGLAEVNELVARLYTTTPDVADEVRELLQAGLQRRDGADQAELGMQLLRLSMEAQLIDRKTLDAHPGMELLRLTMKLRVITTMSLDVHPDMRPLHLFMKLQLVTLRIDTHHDMQLQIATTITETGM